eukprot:SAG11_NODE_3002_length_2776_cov_1.699290_3_plen_208_part_00
MRSPGEPQRRTGGNRVQRVHRVHKGDKVLRPLLRGGRRGARDHTASKPAAGSDGWRHRYAGHSVLRFVVAPVASSSSPYCECHRRFAATLKGVLYVRKSFTCSEAIYMCKSFTCSEVIYMRKSFTCSEVIYMRKSFTCSQYYIYENTIRVSLAANNLAQMSSTHPLRYSGRWHAAAENPGCGNHSIRNASRDASWHAGTRAIRITIG